MIYLAVWYEHNKFNLHFIAYKFTVNLYDFNLKYIRLYKVIVI